METAIHLLGTGLFAGMEEGTCNLESFSRLQDASATSAGRPLTILCGADAVLARARCAGELTSGGQA